jgi:hypothetical protein
MMYYSSWVDIWNMMKIIYDTNIICLTGTVKYRPFLRLTSLILITCALLLSALLCSALHPPKHAVEFDPTSTFSLLHPILSQWISSQPYLVSSPAISCCCAEWRGLKICHAWPFPLDWKSCITHTHTHTLTPHIHSENTYNVEANIGIEIEIEVGIRWWEQRESRAESDRFIDFTDIHRSASSYHTISVLYCAVSCTIDNAIIVMEQTKWNQ